MATAAERKQAGRILTQWHSSMGDPIYAVGSFYIDGHEYPDDEVLESAISGAERCIELAETKRDERDLQYAIRVMRDELGQLEGEEEWSGGIDPETLDQLVQMAAESIGMSEPDEAQATEAVFQEAERFDAAVQKALTEVAKKWPPAGDSSAQDIYEDDGSYAILMTLRGEGVGIWDGRWDSYYDDDEIKQISAFLKKRLGVFADDTGGGSLEEEFVVAAEETGGDFEEEE